MLFTALHRALGISPGALTDAMIDASVANRVAETDDLDWKSHLPPSNGIQATDFPKDVAAMANSGGGTLVYGVEAEEKAATGRRDVGHLTERHEQALRSAAVTAISPPVFGLGVFEIAGESGKRAVVIVVPPSSDGPHLIYKGECFGAPFRNDADTFWMKERQIEAAYRARFDERRHAGEALANLYAEIAAGRDTRSHAWLIAVAHPRLPSTTTAPSREEARKMLQSAHDLAPHYADTSVTHAIQNLNINDPRPGLRRWNAVNSATDERNRWREAWAAIHHDGSVVLATAIGGARTTLDGYAPGNRIDSARIESSVADFMALVRTVSEARGTDAYESRVGINWTGDSPLIIHTADRFGGEFDTNSIPLARYTPVDVTVIADASELDYTRQVHGLAQDCINQGGISNVRLIAKPEDDD